MMRSKVTVVATGLGDANAPNMVIDNSARQSFSNGHIDYEQLDRPSYTRSNQDLKAPTDEPTQRNDADYLDVPAFLRRQAD